MYSIHPEKKAVLQSQHLFFLAFKIHPILGQSYHYLKQLILCRMKDYAITMQAASGHLGGEGRVPRGGGRQQHDDRHVQGGGEK